MNNNSHNTITCREISADEESMLKSSLFRRHRHNDVKHYCDDGIPDNSCICQAHHIMNK